MRGVQVGRARLQVGRVGRGAGSVDSGEERSLTSGTGRSRVRWSPGQSIYFELLIQMYKRSSKMYKLIESRQACRLTAGPDRLGGPGRADRLRPPFFVFSFLSKPLDATL